MNNQERAKQFMPFDAMKGLQEELSIREERRTRVQKKEISEEQIERISRVLSRLRKESRVAITLYSKGHYISIEGVVTEVCHTGEYIKIGSEKVYYDDIYEIAIIEA